MASRLETKGGRTLLHGFFSVVDLRGRFELRMDVLSDLPEGSCPSGQMLCSLSCSLQKTSLICYLLGITDIDPIKENIAFSRFLNETILCIL